MLPTVKKWEKFMMAVLMDYSTFSRPTKSFMGLRRMIIEFFYSV